MMVRPEDGAAQPGGETVETLSDDHDSNPSIQVVGVDWRYCNARTSPARLARSLRVNRALPDAKPELQRDRRMQIMPPLAVGAQSPQCSRLSLQPFQGGDLGFQFGDGACGRGVVDEHLLNSLDLRFGCIVEVFRIIEAIAIE